MDDSPSPQDRASALRRLRETYSVCPLGSVRMLERLTYETHKNGLLQYEERVRALIFAASESNVKLFMDDPTYVAALDAKGLRSSQEQSWYDKIDTETSNENVVADQLAQFELLPSEAAIATGPALNRCRKCGSTEVEWHQRQTRSADEGITTFCQCRQCGKRWRQ